jgi:hypothetical protein
VQLTLDMMKVKDLGLSSQEVILLCNQHLVVAGLLILL